MRHDDVHHDDPRGLDRDAVRRDGHDPGVSADTATPPVGSPFGTPGPATTEPATDPVTDAGGRRHHESESLDAEPGMVDPDPRGFADTEPVPGSEPELLVEPERIDGPVSDGPVSEATSAAPTAGPVPTAGDDAGAVLFGTEDVERFRLRWRELQADFVDDPTDAVRGADELVGELMTALSDIVAEHKQTLEQGWHNGAGETEDLRVALRRYRSFFDQLLKT